MPKQYLEEGRVERLESSEIDGNLVSTVLVDAAEGGVELRPVCFT